MSKIFVDTNILVYAMDRSNRKRRDRCRTLLKQLENKDAEGVISTQVLQEFYVVSTKKIGLDPLLVKNILVSFENFEVTMIDPELIREAIDCHMVNQISFWDALIVVSAASAKCEKIWTEDLNHGQMIHHVQIENPL